MATFATFIYVNLVPGTECCDNTVVNVYQDLVAVGRCCGRRRYLLVARWMEAGMRARPQYGRTAYAQKRQVGVQREHHGTGNRPLGKQMHRLKHLYRIRYTTNRSL